MEFAIAVPKRSNITRTTRNGGLWWLEHPWMRQQWMRVSTCFGVQCDARGVVRLPGRSCLTKLFPFQLAMDQRWSKIGRYHPQYLGLSKNRIPRFIPSLINTSPMHPMPLGIPYIPQLSPSRWSAKNPLVHPIEIPLFLWSTPPLYPKIVFLDCPRKISDKLPHKMHRFFWMIQSTWYANYTLHH